MLSEKDLFCAVLRSTGPSAFFINGYLWIHGFSLSIIDDDNVKTDYQPDDEYLFSMAVAAPFFMLIDCLFRNHLQQ